MDYTPEMHSSKPRNIQLCDKYSNHMSIDTPFKIDIPKHMNI